jgi:hypothetical protein
MKKILIIALLLFGGLTYGQLDTINRGTPNAGKVYLHNGKVIYIK